MIIENAMLYVSINVHTALEVFCDKRTPEIEVSLTYLLTYLLTYYLLTNDMTTVKTL